jgi:hypothetical protein
MSLRIRGEETSLMLVAGAAIVRGFDDVKSFSIEPQMEIKEEEFIGQTSPQFDEIFKGVKGRAECQYSSAAVFDFLMSLIDRAKRRTPGLVVNLKTTLVFANGDRVRLILKNCAFGPMPFGFTGRSEYGTVTLEFACSDIARI